MLSPVGLMTVLPQGHLVEHQGGHIWRCPVQMDDRLGIAYVKLAPKHQLVREVVCRLVAQAVDLPVVQPSVALLDDAGLDAPDRYAFASLEIPRFAADQSTFRSQLSRWPALPLAIAFDEWIGNSDRTSSNLVYSGRSDFTLIDHGEAIPRGNQQ